MQIPLIAVAFYVNGWLYPRKHLSDKSLLDERFLHLVAL